MADTPTPIDDAATVNNAQLKHLCEQLLRKSYTNRAASSGVFYTTDLHPIIKDSEIQDLVEFFWGLDDETSEGLLMATFRTAQAGAHLSELQVYQPGPVHPDFDRD